MENKTVTLYFTVEDAIQASNDLCFSANVATIRFTKESKVVEFSENDLDYKVLTDKEKVKIFDRYLKIFSNSYFKSS